MHTEYNYTAFCQNMKNLRKKYNLTQQQMAFILGISVKSLRKLEDGILPPRLSCDILYRLNSIFGISIDALLSPTD